MRDEEGRRSPSLHGQGRSSVRLSLATMHHQPKQSRIYKVLLTHKRKITILSPKPCTEVTALLLEDMERLAVLRAHEEVVSAAKSEREQPYQEEDERPGVASVVRRRRRAWRSRGRCRRGFRICLRGARRSAR